MRQPSFFIPHGGGPCFFMDWDPPDAWARHRAFFEGLADSLPGRPEAILVVSGHWEAPVFTFQRHPAPALYYDYHGFPPHTYRLSWPAPGAPALAERAAALISAAGLECAFDDRRGFDHGVFVPLKVAFPAADITCLQMSLRADLDPEAHLAAGRALAPLRDEGVLILGSGNSFHNLPVMMRALRGGTADGMAGGTGRGTGRGMGGDVAGTDFDAWLTAAVTHPDPAERARRLRDWQRAPGARQAHPREEHLLPLHVAAGAAADEPGVKVLEDRVMGALESAFRFG